MMTASASPATDPELCRQVQAAACVMRGQQAAEQERRGRGGMHATNMHVLACMHAYHGSARAAGRQCAAGAPWRSWSQPGSAAAAPLAALLRPCLPRQPVAGPADAQGPPQAAGSLTPLHSLQQAAAASTPGHAAAGQCHSKAPDKVEVRSFACACCSHGCSSSCSCCRTTTNTSPCPLPCRRVQAAYTSFSSGAASGDFRPFCQAAGYSTIRGMEVCKVHADVGQKLMAAGHYDTSAEGLSR
jgi:hypothetical protein